MKKLVCVIISCMAASLLHAAGPELIWVGGGLKASNQSNPCYYADSFVSLGQMDAYSLFTQPMVTLKGGDPGFDLGIGGRQPILNGMLLGGNVFFDYTSNNGHNRLGAGLEAFHPNVSGHLNFYMPLTGERNGEEALPGVDLTLGIPVPNAAFVSVWSGAYYFAGRDRGNKAGLSLMVQVQPIRPLTITAGGRNDALQSGRDRSELFCKVEFAIPLQRLGKDMFAFNFEQYPLDMKGQMDHRVVRDDFIAYEIKRR